jgi:hypothetical protein
MQCPVPSGLHCGSIGKLVSLLQAASAPAQHATATSQHPRRRGTASPARAGAVEEASRMAVTLTHVTPLDK